MDVHPVGEGTALCLPLDCHSLLHLLYYWDAGEWALLSRLFPLSDTFIGMNIYIFPFPGVWKHKK